MNIQLLNYIKGNDYVSASLIAFNQLLKGNQIVKKCKEFLPSMNHLQSIYKVVCSRLNKGNLNIFKINDRSNRSKGSK